MKIIGLDFGTTNSTISFFNEDSGEPNCFTPPAGGDTDYIPTVVAYNKDKKYEVSIGKSAKQDLTFEEFEAYDNFKLLLGKDADKVIAGKTKTPKEVTRDFIKKLLDEYKTAKKIDKKDKLEKIVMTVPNIWVKEESNRTARENIEGIFRELGYKDSEFKLESEPLGAATYFCWSYKQKQGKEYTGHIIVIDYGGGTLDVTLCEATDGKTIKVLEPCGCGEYDKTNGCAGVAFDEAVIQKLILDKKLPIKKGDKKFIKLRNSFEEKKIAKWEETTEDMKAYYRNRNIVEGGYIFKLDYNDNGDKFDVRCEDLNDCFERVNAPKLREALEQINQCLRDHNVDSEDHDRFKVLLVGGFSNFYPVEKEVRKFFKVKVRENDKRFEQPFEIRDRALAISKGAALIAAGEIEIVHTCACTYGYVGYGSNGSKKSVPVDMPVIKKGADIKELIEPEWSERILENAAGENKKKIDDFGLFLSELSAG